MCQIIMILCINSMRMEFQSLESGDPEKKNIAELVKGLKDETASVREESVKKLEKMGPDAYGALGVLVELFKDPNMAVRNSASVAVARIGPRAVPVLCESLGNADDEVRASAAYALAVMGPSANRAVPLLIKTLEKDRNESVRGNVISALGAIGDEKAIPALIRTLRGDSSENIRSDAARVLGRFEKNAKEVVPALIAAINIEPKRHAFETVVDWSVVRFNGDELVAFWAVLSLSGFGFAEISPVLQVIKDPSFRGREFAIQALREFVRSYQQEKRQGDTTRSGDFTTRRESV